jgi:carbamoyl-phosphate synthase large subunit
MDVAKFVGIRGPCVIQLKLSKSGELKIIEINPRLGGGTFFSTLAGANFPYLILEIVCNNKIILPKISEITILRYYEEIVVG